MKCPICRTELFIEGQKRLETLEEHVSCMEVSLKDAYACPNDQCQGYKKVCWSWMGEAYYPYREKFDFIDNNDAPFGSFQRKMNVEIYKKDENKFYRIGKWKIELYWIYQSNDDGDILNKTRHVRFWKKDENGCYTHYIPGIRMLIFSIKHFHKELSYKTINSLSDLHDWEKKDWWRVAAHQYKRYYFKVKGIHT